MIALPIIIVGDGSSIMDNDGRMLMTEIDPPLAQFTVKAINNHQKMIDHLKMIKNIMRLNVLNREMMIAQIDEWLKEVEKK